MIINFFLIIGQLKLLFNSLLLKSTITHKKIIQFTIFFSKFSHHRVKKKQFLTAKHKFKRDEETHNKFLNKNMTRERKIIINLDGRDHSTVKYHFFPFSFSLITFFLYFFAV